MKTFLLVLQLLIVLILSALILLQSSKGGLQTQMGGPDYFRTKRGAEKIIFTATIISALLFFLVTIINGIIA